MTIDELLAREAIRQTMAQYNQAGDRLKVEEFVLAFTEDGVLETGACRFAGRAAIRGWLTGWHEPGRTSSAPTRPPRFVRHNLTTCSIELTGPDTAKARTYWLVYTDIGPDHCGYYVDQFRKTGDRWLIQYRTARTDWMAADSRFGSPNEAETL